MTGVQTCALPICGRIVFVELKAPGQKQTAIQVRVTEMLRALGADVRVIDSKEAVDALFA